MNPRCLALLLIASASALGCSSEPSCADACENLHACGKLRDSLVACESACKNDPTVLEADVRCFAESTCEEIRNCFSPTSPEVCYEMCTHIYDACGSKLELWGRTVDKEECMAFCRSELTEKEANCVRHSGCGRLSEVGQCFAG